MSNPRIRKKIHNRCMADFLIECTEDDLWKQKFMQLSDEDTLDTALEGMPEACVALFAGHKLHYCVEALEWKDVPRKVSRWWPIEESARYFMCYPFEFPESALYLSMDSE